MAGCTVYKRVKEGSEEGGGTTGMRHRPVKQGGAEEKVRQRGVQQTRE